MLEISTIVSGIQPTGNLHIGNYLGAVKNWISLQEKHQDCFFCVVDLHATTILYQAEDFKSTTLNTAISLLSCGIDPNKSTLFIQSQVPYHASLMWLLSSVAPYGDLTRMTQFKDKSKTSSQNINVGLFTYPVLMAADILLYQASHVPVGEDQLQHLEFTREIAHRFNERFGKSFFTPPKPLLSKVQKLKGLDGKAKMSKSLNNYIALTDAPEVVEKKIKSAVTDENRIFKTDKGNPDICNIFTMHKEFSSKEMQEDINTGCRNAKLGCVECKKYLTGNLNNFLAPLHQKYSHYQNNIPLVEEILHEGGLKARKKAKDTYEKTLDIMGIYKFYDH